MISLDDIEIKDFICNETSSFALSIVDIETKKILYTNSAMNNFMVNPEEESCYKAMYGQESQCSWCGLKVSDTDAFEFEYFNEKTNRWYQVQNKPTQLKNGTNVLVSIAIDISMQKEAQAHFITTQVKLVQQTEKLKKAQAELSLLASIDPLTKLFNRRYFTKMSSSILNLAQRKRTDTAIIMIDIDNFKSINDTYGHKIGDDVIVVLSDKLQDLSRKSDIVSRWGGEEFLILLPDTDATKAMVLAQKIRKSVESLILTLENDKILNFTISLGISQMKNESEKDIESVIIRADKALYKAKDSGRNQVFIEI